MNDAESTATKYTSVAHTFAQQTLDNLDDLSCALHLAVEAVIPALIEDRACDAAALRGITRAMSEMISDAADELRGCVTIHHHIPVRRAAKQATTAETA